MPDTVLLLMYREMRTKSMCTYIVSNVPDTGTSFVQFTDCASMSRLQGPKIYKCCQRCFFFWTQVQ